MSELMEPLMRYDWGGDRWSLSGIDSAIRDAQGDPAKLAVIEQELIGVLQSGAKLPAIEYACRQLALIGTARCVPALAAMLADPEQLDRALFALQAIPDAAAGGTLREALTSADGIARTGIVNALGERRDKEAISALKALENGPNPILMAAVGAALRKIGPA
jgi:HEAT repeat protein